jgi:copper transport protein
VLRFNEVVEPVTLRLIDAAGRVVAEATPPAADSIAIALPADLAAGSYVASYRVISADAHPVGGAIVFMLGAPSPAPPAASIAAVDAAREEAWQVAAIVVRGARDAALLFAAGGALFIALVLGAPAGRLAPPLRVAAMLAAVLSLLAVGVVGGLATLAPSPLALSPWRFGLSTTAAASGVATALGAVLIAAALPAHTWLACAGALLATAGSALTGHSAAAGIGAQLLQALHTTAAAFWVGALWPLLVLVRDGDAGAQQAARRFAVYATVAVSALVAAGAWLALAHAGGLAALADSDYGALLALKLAAVAALLALAAVNRWRLVPQLDREPGARRALMATLRVDLALAGLAVATTALLAHTPPPHDPLLHDHPHEPPHDVAVAERGVVVAVSGTRSLIVDVDPGLAGRNTITLAFSDGGAVFLPREVRVEIAQRDAGIEPIVRAATPTGDGRFQLSGPELALAGTWSMRVEALVNDFEKATFETRVRIR